jgi:hypothetical protein
MGLSLHLCGSSIYSRFVFARCVTTFSDYEYRPKQKEILYVRETIEEYGILICDTNKLA